MKSCKNTNGCFIFHREEMCWTHICRLGYWPTTGCCSGRWSSFPQWAQTQTGTQSAEHLHLESHYPLGSRTGVCQGHHNSLCQFLWKWEAGVEVRSGGGEREKKRIKSSQVLQATFFPLFNIIYKGPGEEFVSQVGLWREFMKGTEVRQDRQTNRRTERQTGEWNHQFPEWDRSRHKRRGSGRWYQSVYPYSWS